MSSATRKSTRTLAGKVAYVREAMGEDPARNLPHAVASGVWWTFYLDVKFKASNDGYATGLVLDMIELPSVREVRAAMRRLDRPKPPSPADAPAPYYATRD